MLVTQTPPLFLDLLSNKLRWQLVSALARSDFSVQELQKKVKRSQNLVSYHLGKLKSQRLVKESQSIADGRETYYSIDLGRLQSLYFSLGDSLHPALKPASTESESKPSGPPVRVLFVCTHNSARSQMAEGLLRAKGGDRVQAFSAGTEPSRVNPFAIQAMNQLGIDIRGQESKNLHRFLHEKFDYVITVCDRAKESCPIFPGAPEQIHWSFPDPADVQGSDEKKAKAFYDTALQLSQRINYLMMMFDR